MICWKIRHATQQFALNHLERLRRDPRVRAPQLLNTYFHAKCGCWHVGHNWQWMNHQVLPIRLAK